MHKQYAAYNTSIIYFTGARFHGIACCARLPAKAGHALVRSDFMATFWRFTTAYERINSVLRCKLF